MGCAPSRVLFFIAIFFIMTMSCNGLPPYSLRDEGINSFVPRVMSVDDNGDKAHAYKTKLLYIVRQPGLSSRSNVVR